VRLTKLVPAVLSFLLVPPVWGRVFLRWSLEAVPAAERLGVRDLVISWDPAKLDLFRNAARQGYRVYAQTDPGQVAAVARSAAKARITGVLINPGDSSRTSIAGGMRRLRATYPALDFLVLNPGAVQPKMRGTMVLNRNGVLQATSPTAQPWIDTNLALVRLDQALFPGQLPVYSFSWDLSGAAKEAGPDLADYALATAEAGAFGSAVLLSLHEPLARGLADNEASAWSLWREEREYLRFYSGRGRRPAEPAVAVIADDDPASFEPINLLVRHNVAVRVFSPPRVSGVELAKYPVVVALASPTPSQVRILADRARNGGTVVVLNLNKASYPWQSSPASQNNGTSVSFQPGTGKVIELLQPISDPESFAQDIRALIPDNKLGLSLWNALTVIGVMYNGQTENIVELLNYAADPLDVQVRVKGTYTSVKLETPEHGCCVLLKPSAEDGFTEFAVPSLYISGRLHLIRKARR